MPARESKIHSQRAGAIFSGNRRIFHDNPQAAARFRKRAEQALKRLERFPNSGRHLAEFPDLPHREVIVPPYRFFYRQQGDIVWIVAAWHGAQIPKAPDPH